VRWVLAPALSVTVPLMMSLAATPVACWSGESGVAGTSGASAKNPHFAIREYRVLGNTVLPMREVETLLYGLLGVDKSLDDVESARAALEKIYRDRGYGTVFVDIPPQSVTDGIVRLRVIEGRVNQTTIGGARYFREGEILAQLPEAKPGTIPNIGTLQQQLTDVNAQNSDRTVIPVLKAGPVSGTVDMTLKVDDHLPLHGSVELNNEYTPDTSPLRATVALSYSNLFADLDTLSAQYQLAPQQPSQVGVVAVNYAEHPLFGAWRPSIYFINSNSAVSTIGTLNVLGKGQIAGVRMADTVASDSTSVQVLTLGADYKHFRQSVNLETGLALNTPISYVNLSVAYDGSWRSDHYLASANASANFGPRGLANSPAAFENDRFAARSNYFYARGSGSVTWLLPAQWQLTGRLGGQYTREPVISNENFSIAGFDGVRGYLEAEALGDSALKGTVQLQTPPLHRHGYNLADAYVFLDAAHANVLAALPGEPQQFTLRSRGVGLDLLPGRAVSGSLIWAVPLVAGSRTRSHDGRYLFVVRGSF